MKKTEFLTHTWANIDNIDRIVGECNGGKKGIQKNDVPICCLSSFLLISDVHFGSTCAAVIDSNETKSTYVRTFVWHKVNHCKAYFAM